MENNFKQAIFIIPRALYWNLLGLIFILTVSLGVGLVIYTKYYDCDPLLAKRIEISEQVSLLVIEISFVSVHFNIFKWN